MGPFDLRIKNLLLEWQLHGSDKIPEKISVKGEGFLFGSVLRFQPIGSWLHYFQACGEAGGQNVY